MALTALLLLPIACGVDRGELKTSRASAAAEVEEPSPETFALGTSVNKAGAVPAQASGDNFRVGEEVFLSVDVGGASTEQVLEVRWMDGQGHVLHRDVRHATKGTRYVPFSSGHTEQWRSGDHRAVVIIDGRAVAEKSFAVM